MAPRPLLLLLASAIALLSTSLPFPALCVRVPAPPLRLAYHNGPLLSDEHPLKLYLVFYGDFSPSERNTLLSFLASLSSPSQSGYGSLRASSLIRLPSTPSVPAWWSLTRAYTDTRGRGVSQNVQVYGETIDSYSLGKNLKQSDLAALARLAMAELSSPPGGNSMAVVVTAADVFVEGFCMHSCGGHDYTNLGSSSSSSSSSLSSDGDGSAVVPYAWVGNDRLQCPGFCSWPFAKPVYGPPMDPLIAPNGVAEDGMVMNLARVLVSAATNPFRTAYYEGEGSFVLREAAGACAGTYGHGAYPGFPGKLMINPTTGASYNMEGINGIQFLVPWIWNPHSLSCAGRP